VKRSSHPRCEAWHWESHLAPYAIRSSQSRGRRYPEPEHPYRSPFQRDRDRIVHSAAYRRLAYKTQVFTGELGDYHRTRLTHTLEVASVARTLARTLRLNEDLVEALALAHDLGHPPFGHAGEAALDECLACCGGFNHNRQALRIVELLEERYPEFPGLNLTEEVLNGQRYRIAKEQHQAGAPLEVQVVEAADSVSYDTHDLDDALHLGLIRIEQLAAVPFWREATQYVRKRWTNLEADQLRRATIHRLIDWQVSDLLAQASERIEQWGIDSPVAVARAGPIVVPSASIAEQKRQLEEFLHQRVYRNEHLLRVRAEAQEQLQEMFRLLLRHPEQLPERFRQLANQQGLPRTVGDYLAGMTDRFARRQYELLCRKCGRPASLAD